MSGLNLPSFSLKPSPHVLSQQALLKHLSPSFLSTPFKYGKVTISSPWNLLFSRLNTPTLPACPASRAVPASDHFCGSSGPSPTGPCVSCAEGSRAAKLQVGSHHSGTEGQNHLPQLAGHGSFDAVQDTIGLLGCKCTLPAHVQFPLWDAQS